MQPKDYYNQRVSSMKVERESFIPHWRELSEFVKPRKGRFQITDRNKGEKRYQAIINSKATQAHRIAVSGMLAGTMSPTRPWFVLEPDNIDLREAAGVKDWLYFVESKIRSVLNESNFYGMASQLLSELLLFGTAAMTHVDDFQDVARFYTHTIGSYMIGLDDRCAVDTLVREFELPAIQIVKKFGIENVSTYVKEAVDKKNFDSWFPVCHVIEPNDEYRNGSALAKNKAFKSVYYEPACTGVNKNKWLQVSGYDSFPAYVPRWDVTGEDIYGTDCPGMTALGDIKGLQLEERRKAQALDKMISPPMAGPSTLRGSQVNSLPAGVTLYDGNEQNKLSPLYQIQPNLQEMRLDIQAVEQRIDTAFFVDMFLAISNIEGIQPRNQLDLIQRNEERLLQIGPVLERMQTEFLDPLIERVFQQALKAGILPPVPEVLNEQPLKINYISTLAQAQRSVASQSIERVLGFAGNLAALGMTDALAKINAPQSVDEYARAIGVPPTIIRSDDEVAAIIQKQNEAAEAERQIAMAEGLASTAKTAGEAIVGRGGRGG